MAACVSGLFSENLFIVYKNVQVTQGVYSEIHLSSADSSKSFIARVHS